MRKTKIICTIGPACEDEKILSDMIDAGMNVARLNFSHGTHEEHKKKIDLLKKVRDEKNVPMAIMLDTKGPEYRIGIFEGGSCEINEGDQFTFTTDDVTGDATKVSVSYKNLHKELEPGDKVLVNNGLLEFTVSEIKKKDIICNVDVGGKMSDRKSMSFPGKVLKQVYLSEQDKSDILFGIENDVEYIACSFVSSKKDIKDVLRFIKDHKLEAPGIIAKIENQAGIDNVEDICSVCDGVMIGRGDLGVEIPFEELPAIQKQIITKCRLLGKRVITATEMLESMMFNTRPTRAESSDVANAVYDGSSAIMLSGETASGKYPVLTVETMARIAETTEKSMHFKRRFAKSDISIGDPMDAISHSIYGLATELGVKCIVICSLSGRTARMVSRFRPSVDILGMSVNKKTWHQLSLSWGVKPVMCEMYPSMEILFYSVKQIAKNELNLQPGDKIIITGGEGDFGAMHETDTIKFETI